MPADMLPPFDLSDLPPWQRVKIALRSRLAIHNVSVAAYARECDINDVQMRKYFGGKITDPTERNYIRLILGARDVGIFDWPTREISDAVAALYASQGDQ